MFLVVGFSGCHDLGYEANNSGGDIEIGEPEIIITSDYKYGNAPITVKFSSSCNNFTKNITSYRWDFDDGNSYSSQKNATWIFEENGLYEITLMVSYIDLYSGNSVTNDTNTFYSEKYLLKIENIKPVVNASSNIKGGEVPLYIQFSGSAEDLDGDIVSYHWDFGDGAASDQLNPDHTFSESGIYYVELTVTDDQGENSTDTIIINAKPSSFFTITGRITNYYYEPVDVDYMVLSSGSWNDLGGTVYNIGENEKDRFTINVKKGFDSYTLIIGWFYQFTDIQVDREDYDFTNTNSMDMDFDIVISSSGNLMVMKS